ncbi:MAG: YggS family pyridoxal phosphate-dependent enzyme [Acidobacteriota bacterium]|nr:YggS family pyridoxal phosphate-dependent enzyme [Acidobacteriota bacterium]
MSRPSSADAAERLAVIRRRIVAACGRVGRQPGEVVLVAASKTQPAAILADFHAAGLRIFGENRVQEALAKAAALVATPARIPKDPETASDSDSDSDSDIEWHLIGPLQSNKARVAAGLFLSFHALDRAKIALALDHEASLLGRRITGFLEINVGEEPSKHGFTPRGLPAAVRPLAELEHLRIVGLMAIPPQEAEPEGARRWFRRLRELRDELAALPEWAGFPGHLSMGMSGDFEVAIEEGATHVRVGTALFGSRPPLDGPAAIPPGPGGPGGAGR